MVVEVFVLFLVVIMFSFLGVLHQWRDWLGWEYRLQNDL